MSSHLMTLNQIRKGKELSNYLGAESSITSYPDLNEITRPTVQGLLQNIQDCGDIWDDIPVSGRIDLEKGLGDQISELNEIGLFLYLHTHHAKMKMPGVEESFPWKFLVIVISDEDIERLKAEIEIPARPFA
jgi:hypothetical protein